MDARFDQNGLEQGYGRIVLEMSENDVPFTQGDSIAIGRPVGADEYEFISSGAGSWAGNPQALKFANPPEQNGNQITFILHPAYVDMIEDGNYTLVLLGADKKEKNQAQFGAYDVVWSGLDNTGALPDYQEEEARKEAAKAAEAKRKAEEEAKAEQERQAAEAKRRAEEEAKAEQERQAAEAKRKAEEEAKAEQERQAAEAKRKAEEEAKAEQERQAAEAKRRAEEEAKAGQENQISAEDEHAPEPYAPKKSRTGLVAAILILAILGLAGGGGYYWYSQKQAQEAAEAARAEAERKAAEEAARKAAEAEAARKAAAEAEAARKAAAEETAKKARADARGRVGAFFAGQRSPEGALKLADELDKDTPEQQDAIFRLYYYGAGQNYPQASLKYAECLDPSRPAWGTVKKDAPEAWYYYGQAPNGEKARQEMKAWVEKEAAAGNAQARAWLSKME